MSSVTLEGLTKEYQGGVLALDHLSLQIADGEFMCLVGPSGCGKTTALRMICGLEEISAGVVRIGDRIVNDLAARDRDIALVFQSYALYPHMTVFKNMSFGLELRKRRAPLSAQKLHDLGCLRLIWLMSRHCWASFVRFAGQAGCCTARGPEPQPGRTSASKLEPRRNHIHAR